MTGFLLLVLDLDTPRASPGQAQEAGGLGVSPLEGLLITSARDHWLE